MIRKLLLGNSHEVRPLLAPQYGRTPRRRERILLKLFGGSPGFLYPSRVTMSTGIKTKNTALYHVIADPIARANQWRLAFLCVLLVLIYMAYTTSDAYKRAKHIPMVLLVDATTGHIISAGGTSQISPEELHAQGTIRKELARWVRAARSVPMDRPMLDKAVNEVLLFLDRNSSSPKFKLWAYESEEGLYTRFERGETVDVEVSPPQPIPGTKSWQVMWKETVYSKSRRVLDQYQMIGTFTLQFRNLDDIPSLTAEQKARVFAANPLGMYLDFSWARDVM